MLFSNTDSHWHCLLPSLSFNTQRHALACSPPSRAQCYLFRISINLMALTQSVNGASHPGHDAPRLRYLVSHAGTGMSGLGTCPDPDKPPSSPNQRIVAPVSAEKPSQAGPRLLVESRRDHPQSKNLNGGCASHHQSRYHGIGRYAKHKLVTPHRAMTFVANAPGAWDLCPRAEVL